MRRILERALATALFLPLAFPAFAGQVACYEEVHAPAVYGEVETLGPIGPARAVRATTQGQYALVTDFVPVRPSITTIDPVAPTYGKVARPRIVQPARTVIHDVPAVTRIVMETVVVKPARETWEWRIIDGKRVRCRIVIPAETVQRAREIIVKPARRWVERMPAVTRIELVSEQVAPRGVRIRASPPLHAPSGRIVEVTPERSHVNEVEPAPYGLVKQRVVVRPGGPALRRVHSSGC